MTDPVPTFQEYLTQAMEYVGQHPAQRLGQALFNALHYIRPDLSEQLRGTELDPFNFDNRVDDFLNWVSEHWPAESESLG